MLGQKKQLLTLAKQDDLHPNEISARQVFNIIRTPNSNPTSGIAPRFSYMLLVR